MTDDDPTPRIGRPRSHWDDADRALVGAAHRRNTHPGGVPVPPVAAPTVVPLAEDFSDVTPVFDLIERPPSPAAAEAIRRSKRDSGDPAYFVDIANLAAEVALLRKEERANNTARANDALRLANPPPDVVQLQERVSTLSKVMGALAIAVLGSVLAVGSLIYSRGFTEGGDKVRLELLEKTVDELRRDLRALEQRHASATPAISPDAITSAEGTP